MLAAVITLAQIDLDPWLKLLRDIEGTLFHAPPQEQRDCLVRALRDLDKAHGGKIHKRRYQCMSTPRLIEVLEQLANRAEELPRLLQGRPGSFGEGLASVKHLASLYLLDAARSLQLASSEEAPMLLAADELPLALERTKGSYKRIAPKYEEVFARRPTAEEAMLVLREMQRLSPQVAQSSWQQLCAERPEEQLQQRWGRSMAQLFFRTATVMDMEMLACEVGKLEMSKGYFEVERDWGSWCQDSEAEHGVSLLRQVPLCTLAGGEEPGGRLETRCVDLRPSPVKMNK
jgi:hypothetical protein